MVLVGIRQAMCGIRAAQSRYRLRDGATEGGFHQALTSEDAMARWARDVPAPTGLIWWNGTPSQASHESHTSRRGGV
jgi:hypothetical protein